jgi:hypothetical protein
VETLQACVTSRYEPTKMTGIKTWQTDITAAAASSVSPTSVFTLFSNTRIPSCLKAYESLFLRSAGMLNSSGVV